MVYTLHNTFNFVLKSNACYCNHSNHGSGMKGWHVWPVCCLLCWVVCCVYSFNKTLETHTLSLNNFYKHWPLFYLYICMHLLIYLQKWWWGQFFCYILNSSWLTLPQNLFHAEHGTFWYMLYFYIAKKACLYWSFNSLYQLKTKLTNIII